MTTAYIGIGSNIEPEKNIESALRMLAEKVRVIGVSTFYRTEALNRPGSPPFINGAASIETDLDPRELKFGLLRAIEEALGRVRTEDKYAPRTIDLDVMIYGDLALDEPDIVIPDPDIRTRPFVAIPLLELAPDLVLPDTGIRLADLVEAMPTGSMVPLPGFPAFSLLKERTDT